MKRRIAMLSVLGLAAVCGGCTFGGPKKEAQAVAMPSLIVGDKIGCAAFANQRGIAWAQTRPADAFAQYRSSDLDE